MQLLSASFYSAQALGLWTGEIPRIVSAAEIFPGTSLSLEVALMMLASWQSSTALRWISTTCGLKGILCRKVWFSMRS